MMQYRRTSRLGLPRLAFVLGLVLLGLALPLFSNMLAPAGSGLAAALPTARVLAPPAGPVVIARLPAKLLPGSAGAPPAVVAEAQPTSGGATPTTAPPTEPPTTAPQAEPQPAAQAPAPTLTNTPIPLGPIVPDGGRPVPTLFPTLPAQGPAAVPAPENMPLAAPAPILMYHYVRVVDAASDPLGYNLSVTPDDFERQIAWLSEQGYHGVRMDALARCLRGEALCPAKAIALTFDDGYADAYTAALPVLKRYGMPATFYIISGLVGQPGYMSWEQLAAMRDAGMELGAHTVNHYDLTSLDAATASYEISQVKSDLEQHLGIAVTSFCYPTGLYNAGIEEQVRAAGYRSATTTRWDGDYSDMLALPRRRVAGGTSLDGFAGIVTSG